MKIVAQQVTSVPFPHAQQVATIPMQAATIPAATATTAQLDIDSMMNLMITMMIVVMMMKMMTGAMGSVTAS